MNHFFKNFTQKKELDSILKNGAERAETIANKNYKEIERVVGI